MITKTLCIACALASTGTTENLAEQSSEKTVISNVTVISPERPTPLRNAWVTLHEGRIDAVGQGDPPKTSRIQLDGKGGFLIPGLIDSHVHLYHATGLRRNLTKDYDRLYAAYMEQQPRSYLYFGFTSVVELNADFETNARFEQAAVAPRLYHCGQGVILSDGFMSLEIPDGALEKAYPGYLIDHHSSGQIPGSAKPEDHTPRSAVDHVKKAGGKCVKLYYEEALWWPGPQKPDFKLPSPQIIKDMVQEAHVASMPVLLHATTPEGVRMALDSGVDILAHGMWEWPSQPFDAMTPLPEYNELLMSLAKSRVRLQPTFNTLRNTFSLFAPELLEDQDWQHVVPRAYHHYLKTDAQAQKGMFIKMFADVITEQASGKPIRSLQQDFNTRYEAQIAQLYNSGARLIFGTDTAVGGFGWGSPPGLAGYWEMQTWARIGIPLNALLAAMTIDNATAFGLEAELGTIEPDKTADLILLRKNPLESIEAYNTVSHVILGGKIIDRAQLSARQEKLGAPN